MTFAATVIIDPNMRLWGNQTVIGLEDADALVQVGERVRVLEQESGAQGDATVTEVDLDKRLIYLRVDWPSLRVVPVRQREKYTRADLQAAWEASDDWQTGNGPDFDTWVNEYQMARERERFAEFIAHLQSVLEDVPS